MRAYFSRRYRLSASHRLYTPRFSDEQNLAAFGKCANPHGHGHNYVVEVTVGGEIDPVTGMVCNMADLDECVKNEIIDRFDHTNLNLASHFTGLVPTTENFCILIFGLLSSSFTQGELVRVRIEETQNNFFEYPTSAPFLLAGQRQSS